MLDGSEGVDGLPGHPLGGTVRGDEIREGGLEVTQLAHERVVLDVGDLGTRLHVIEIVVMVDRLAQLREPLRRVGARHAAQHTPRLTAPSTPTPRSFRHSRVYSS